MKQQLPQTTYLAFRKLCTVKTLASKYLCQWLMCEMDQTKGCCSSCIEHCRRTEHQVHESMQGQSMLLLPPLLLLLLFITVCLSVIGLKALHLRVHTEAKQSDSDVAADIQDI